MPVMSGWQRARTVFEAALTLILLFLGSLIFNAASNTDRWPGHLDLIRRYPWWAFALLLAVGVTAEILLRKPFRRGQQPDHRVVFALPPRYPWFVGRAELLKLIHSVLTRRSVSTVHALVGMAGAGKTQLAVEYAHRRAGYYDVVAFFHAAQAEQLPGQFAALAATLDLDADSDLATTVARVHAELPRRGRWLLIFDNAEDPGHLLPYCPGTPGAILVTSRWGSWVGRGDVVEVDVFSRTESTDLLALRIPGVTSQVADGIAEALGDHPLALEQAASFVGTSEPTPATYLERLQHDLEPALSQGTVSDRPGVTVVTLWRMSAQRLAARDPAALRLANLLAAMAPEPLPIDYLAPADSLHHVVELGVVRREGDAVVMHRLTRAAIRGDMSVEELREANDIAVRILASRLPSQIHRTPQDWPEWARMLPHVLAVTDNTSERGHQLTLLGRAGLYLQQLGDAEHALVLMRRAVQVAEDLHGKDHETVGYQLNHLGDALREFGDPAAARPVLERAVALAEGSREPDFRALAVRLSNLGLVMRRLREYDVAEALLRRALALAEREFGELHPETGVRFSALGLILRDRGDLEGARLMLERALAIAVDSQGPHHPRVATRLHHLANVHRDLGDHDKGIRLLQRSVAISEAIYGPDHRRTRIKREQLASWAAQA
jgi:tetratricopeptide (TPR) repeat protein